MANIELGYLTCIEQEQAEQLIGKVVAGVEAGEYRLTLTFTDGSKLEIRGHTYDGCALDVGVIPVTG